MPNFINLTGKVFSFLTVIEHNLEKSQKRSFWTCSCECGKTCVVSGDKLCSGRQISCGCQQFAGFKANNQEKENSDSDIKKINLLWSHYRNSGKNRNIEFNLSREEIKTLVESYCYYCGIVPSNSMSSCNKKHRFVYQGIDRIDSSKGYITGNVLPCCRPCNTAKGVLHIREFEIWAKRLALKYGNSNYTVYTNYEEYQKIVRPDLYNPTDIIPDEG